MKDWQEPQESFLRMVVFAALRLVHLRRARYRGRRARLARDTISFTWHSLRRIALRTPGIVLVSAPKSGRTWLRFMLDELGIHIRYTHVGLSVERPGDLKGRLIHLHRDPRDTIVSAWYHHRKRQKDYGGPLADFLRDPRLGLEACARFNLFWAGQAEAAGGCVTSYEAIRADTAGELARIVRFITGEAPDETRLSRAVAAGAFDRMRALEASGHGARRYGYALAPGDRGDPDSYKIRSGKMGTWRAHFTQADAAFADAVLERHDYFERMRSATAAQV